MVRMRSHLDSQGYLQLPNPKITMTFEIPDCDLIPNSLILILLFILISPSVLVRMPAPLRKIFGKYKPLHRWGGTTASNFFITKPKGTKCPKVRRLRKCPGLKT